MSVFTAQFCKFSHASANLPNCHCNDIQPNGCRFSHYPDNPDVKLFRNKVCGYHLSLYPSRMVGRWLLPKSMPAAIYNSLCFEIRLEDSVKYGRLDILQLILMLSRCNGHDSFALTNVKSGNLTQPVNAVITIAIRLRYDYDPTTTHRARLLPFDANKK